MRNVALALAWIVSLVVVQAFIAPQPKINYELNPFFTIEQQLAQEKALDQAEWQEAEID